MGVYLPNMEMPENCICCDLSHEDGWCPAKQTYTDSYTFKTCPLVPVPPHGDLIDRNVLYHNMFIGPDEKVFPDRDVDNFPHEMRFEDIKRFIRKAQTVIQASE